MATLYNKTALKKVKKDELIKMFLDQQARLNSYTIGLDGVCDACKTLQEENEKLKQKATAWDIINSGDWEYIRDLCDKEMCKDLIECGECKEEDFEGYEGYED